MLENLINAKEYRVDNILNDQTDTDIIDMVVSEYEDESYYICDAISEMASEFVPIYNSDLLDNAWELYSNGWTEEAISNYGSLDLIEMMRYAWDCYNSSMLYSNIDKIIYNIALIQLEKEGVDTNTSILELELEPYLTKVDGNSTFEDITEAVREYADDYTGLLEHM